MILSPLTILMCEGKHDTARWDKSLTTLKLSGEDAQRFYIIAEQFVPRKQEMSHCFSPDAQSNVFY